MQWARPVSGLGKESGCQDLLNISFRKSIKLAPQCARLQPHMNQGMAPDMAQGMGEGPVDTGGAQAGVGSVPRRLETQACLQAALPPGQLQTLYP